MQEIDFFTEDVNKYIFTQPINFSLDGNLYECKTWVALIDEICYLLKLQDPTLMKSFLKDEQKRKQRIVYIADNAQAIHFFKHLEKSDLYLNQKIDAPRSVKLLRLLLKKYNIREEFSLNTIRAK